MKTTLAFIAIVGAIAAPFLYDASDRSRCEISYTTSFNGLYLIKQRTCYGRLGIPGEPREIARKPLFVEF